VLGFRATSRVAQTLPWPAEFIPVLGGLFLWRVYLSADGSSADQIGIVRACYVSLLRTRRCVHLVDGSDHRDAEDLPALQTRDAVIGWQSFETFS